MEDMPALQQYRFFIFVERFKADSTLGFAIPVDKRLSMFVLYAALPVVKRIIKVILYVGVFILRVAIRCFELQHEHSVSL